MELIIAGLVVMGIGVVLILLGIYMSWSEFRMQRKQLSEMAGGEAAAGFVEALAELIKALAGQPRSVTCFAFGTILVFLGGLIAGVAGLAA